MSRLRRLFTLVNRVENKTSNYVIVGLIIVCCSILYVSSQSIKFSNAQRRSDASGFSHDKAKHFAYFHYYKNSFPLATLDTNITYSKDAAESLIENSGENLIMEYQHWSRLGENARIFAYLPNSILKGTPASPSIRLFNSLVFTICLVICYLGFAKNNQRAVGLSIITILLLTPYFRYEVYQNENIFGLLIPLFLACVALNLQLINKNSSIKKLIIIPLITGIIVGFFSEMRGEIIIIVASIILLYLFSKNLMILGKILAIIILVGSVFTTKKSIVSYFGYKFDEAYQLVKEKGGHVYNGKRIEGHKFWHPVYCGLGDFDNKFDYEWNDRAAYKYALPILKEKYNSNIKYSGKLHLDNYYDRDHLYYIKFDEIDEYEEIVKNKVINDIRNNPLWYAKIIIKRINRILSETLPFHWIGWIGIPFLIFLYIKKQWFDLMILLAGLPLSFTPLFIYSGGNSTYNSVFGIIILALLIKHINARFIRFSK